MDISDDFLDFWSAQDNLIDHDDFLESLNEQIGEKILSSSQLPHLSPLSLQLLTDVSSNNVENEQIDGLIPIKSTDSNKNNCEIKEFSDAIDAYFSPCYPDTEMHENKASLTCYNSSFDTSYNSCTQFNSLVPMNSINHRNSDSSYPSVKIESSGFMKLTLAKDCSKVKEPWCPSVAKKLLASYYSPLSMKSELLSNQIMLDAYESVSLQEAVQAFNDIAFMKQHCDTNLALAIKYDFYSDPRPIELVYSCEKLKAYRKLNTADKIKLMARAFFVINAIKAVITYDETIDGWYIAGELWPRTNISWESPNILKLQNLIETFPDCLRNDLNIIALIYLIIIFNPDAPKLKFRNGVRQEQYFYIDLLKRYLVTLFGHTCEASDYHYRLMVKIEQAIKLPDSLIFEQIQLGSTKKLRNRVVKLVQHESLASITMV